MKNCPPVAVKKDSFILQFITFAPVPKISQAPSLTTCLAKYECKR